MNEEELEERIDAIYRAPLDRFIALRKELADELKKSGKKDVAARVAGLPKPNVVASAVNRHHGAHPAAFAKLLAAGERVRDAFSATLSSGAGAGAVTALAKAQKAQRDAIADALATIEKDAAAAETPLSASVLAKLEPTLLAISTTGRFGEGPAGRLVRELEPPGLEVFSDLPPPKGSARPSEPAPTPPPERRKRHGDTERERARLDGELEAVDAELEELVAERGTLDEDERELVSSEKESSAIAKEDKREVSTLRDRVEHVERELADAMKELDKAERRLASREEELRSVRAKREKIKARREDARTRKTELESRKSTLKKALDGLEDDA